ncbi:peptidase C13 [Rhodanobacter sp. DHB23]|uniref:peptidase C13 n=1 Tax=Rhodanobacter sp. DHB23 TaxID=2775923 RepID=UPI0017828EA9|nr:peptidase C13 [Rhodanobacter sp. DHB23]MBD8871279.1 peptidase C13 [Rhodanobacter sp. DHB23]
MSTVLALALLLGATPATAGDGDFESRVHAAKMAEAAASGPAYQKTLWGHIDGSTAAAYKGCLATSRNDKSPFTLVLDVDAHGRPQHIAVQPATPTANCMAAHFAGLALPAPPAAPVPYPLEIDFSVAP